MSNLYQIIDTNNHAVVATGFATRSDARKHRTKDHYVIGRGEEHPLGPSYGPVSERRQIKSDKKRKKKEVAE